MLAAWSTATMQVSKFGPRPAISRQQACLRLGALPRLDAFKLRSVNRIHAQRLSSPVCLTQEIYSTDAKGARSSLEFRIFFKEKGNVISPWHDIPLWNDDGTANFICEIPKESSAKMEVATHEERTPIKQDVKKGNLRFYPYNINWNYGLLPQTWEDPDHVHPELKVKGDNDPVDVVEIGAAECAMGGVYKVKPVGILAMIDDGELDWKVICINANDPKAALVNDVEDVEREFPGELERIRIWFRDYKIPDGKPENKFGYSNKVQSKEFALKVLEETHGFWKKLKSGERQNNKELSLV